MEFIKVLGMHTSRNLRYLAILILTQVNNDISILECKLSLGVSNLSIVFDLFFQLISSWIQILRNLDLKIVGKTKQNKSIFIIIYTDSFIIL